MCDLNCGFFCSRQIGRMFFLVVADCVGSASRDPGHFSPPYQLTPELPPNNIQKHNNPVLIQDVETIGWFDGSRRWKWTTFAYDLSVHTWISALTGIAVWGLR